MQHRMKLGYTSWMAQALMQARCSWDLFPDTGDRIFGWMIVPACSAKPRHSHRQTDGKADTMLTAAPGGAVQATSARNTLPGTDSQVTYALEEQWP